MQWLPHTHQPQPTSLKSCLQVLPGFKHRALGKVVTTDGSLRTRKHTSGELSMGAEKRRENSRWELKWQVRMGVGGQFSSTRSELVAIAEKSDLQGSCRYLDVSAAALQRLAWCRSSDFRPSTRKIKDADVMHDIMALIRARQDEGHATTFVKSSQAFGRPSPFTFGPRYRELIRKLETRNTQLPAKTTYYINGRTKMTHTLS